VGRVSWYNTNIFPATYRPVEGRTVNDVTTNKPLRVGGGKDGGGVIWLPESQVPDVQKLLDQHGIRYWLQEEIISVDDGPEFTALILSKNEDPQAVQVILDDVP
jgi:ribulose 1,5-bisphosphate synthetase/thiazole synthase